MSASHKLDLKLHKKTDTAQRVATMNGNIVLVPMSVFERLGPIDSVYSHGIGDIDYGLRAGMIGIGVIAAVGVHGVCESHDAITTWTNPEVPLATRWRVLHTPLGMPPREWLHFVRLHAGWRWPISFLKIYLRVAAPSCSISLNRLRRKVQFRKSPA